MKADPEVPPYIYTLRTYVRRYRASYRWLFWSTVLCPVLYLFLPLPVAFSLFAIALCSFLYHRSRLDTLVPHLGCDKERRFARVFDDWVCGGCKKTHTHTELPTRRSWLEACKCNATPDAFICPGCREPILFEDGEPGKSAWLPGYPPVITKPEKKRETPAQTH